MTRATRLVFGLGMLAACGGTSSPAMPDAPVQPDAPPADGPACTGQMYRWAFSTSSPNGEAAIAGAAVDAAGNTWVTGTFVAATTIGTVQLSAVDTVHPSIFVAKLDPGGNVVFARAIQGGTGGVDNIDNGGTRIRPDGHGGAILTGTFQTQLDLDGVHLVESDDGNGAAFVIGLGATGTATFGAISSGSTDGAGGNDVRVDASGDVYVTGSYNGTATFGSITVAGNTGDKAVFVAKYSPASSAWVWAKGWAGQMNGTNDGGVGYGLALTSDGASVYATGSISGTLLADGHLLSADGGSFVVKLDASNGDVAWATEIQPSTAGDRDWASAATVDSAGALYVTGQFVGSPKLAGPAGSTPISLTTTGGGTDMFLAKYGSDGTPAWVQHAGIQTPPGITRGDDVAYDGTDVYVSGYTQGQTAFAGQTLTSTSELFVAKYSPLGAVQWVQGAVDAGGASDSAEAAAVGTPAPPTSLVIAGSYAGSTMFGATTLTAGPNGDAFVAKLCQ